MGRHVLEGVLIVLEDLFVEDIVDVGGEVGAEVARDEDAALLVEDVDRRDSTHSNNNDDFKLCDFIARRHITTSLSLLTHCL